MSSERFTVYYLKYCIVLYYRPLGAFDNPESTIIIITTIIMNIIPTLHESNIS